MNKQTAQLLEQHFDTAFAAPNGIAKLRELILTLAMQGKLVEQDSNDLPASKLLKEIEAEKQRLVKAGKIKQPKPLPPIKPEEIPYELPKGWEWVRLGNMILHMDAGWSPKCETEPAKENEWGVLKTTAVQALRFLPHENKALPVKLAPRPDAQVEENDILITRAGPKNRVGICCVVKSVRPQLMLSDKIIRFRIYGNLIYSDFCALGLNTGYGADQIERMKSGMADSQMNISQDKVKQVIIAIPPLPEQHRIVARIDHLMARCDELEKLRKARETQRLAVHTAAIKQLLDTPDGSAWNFIQQHFGELYTVKQNVAELRKAILQLAVMGRLVEQDPSDPPASELLKEIEAEKQRLVKAGKIKKPKPLPPIKPEEVPYQLPQGWEWVRLGDISLSSDSGWSPQCLPEQRTSGHWGVLKVSAVSWGRFNPDENKALPSDKQPRAECEVKTGDFLLSRANTDELVARSVIVEEAPEKLMMSDKIVRFQLSQHVSKYFINFINGTDFSRAYYIANASGTSSSMKNVSRQVMAELPISLPPLSEQHRIVARINQLMALCDTLEQRIDASTEKQTELLNALLNAQPRQHSNITDLAAYRSTIGCYIVKNMAASQYFGRTTAAKTLYLAQAHAGLDLDLHPVREAAGPFDKRIYDFEQEGESNSWFKVKEKKIKAGHTKTEYIPMPGLKAQASQAESAMTAEKRKHLDNLIGLLKDKTTEEVEIIATLFAAWNDFLIDGIKPSDDKIITEVRENWHERKSRFSPKKLSQWLDWMRSQKLIPQGRSPKTIQQYRLEL